LTYENLLIEADEQKLMVKEKPLSDNDGRIKGKRIAIRQNMPEIKKACVLAEELGHYHTSAGNILDQSNILNRKQELHARLWAYNKQIGLTGLLGAYKHGCRNQYEVAEFLNVTEKFLSDALKTYKTKYGVQVTIDNYVIYFEPHIGVLELL